MINKELKWIIKINGEPGVLNISAFEAKNGAIPLSPAIPTNIINAPNIVIGATVGIIANLNKLKTISLTGWDTSSAKITSSMFVNCSSLKTIKVSNSWTMSNVTNSSGMFYGCSSLTGGNGTTFDSGHIDATYARIDTASTPGYLTLKTI